MSDLDELSDELPDDLPDEPPEPDVPPPPEDPAGVLAWAEAHGVGARLDDVIFGDDGIPGTYLPTRDGTTRTYRQVLVEGDRAQRRSRLYFDDTWETARRYLHEIARLVAAHRIHREEMDAHGAEPEDEVLAALLGRLRRELAAPAPANAAPVGTYQPLLVRIAPPPTPMLCYRERMLREGRWSGSTSTGEVALPLIGWNDGAELSWRRMRSDTVVALDVTPTERRHALEAFVDFLRDRRHRGEQDALAEILRTPDWQHTIDALDRNLAALPAGATRTASGAMLPAPPRKVRVAFRITFRKDQAYDLQIDPLIQKRGRDGRFSRGAKLPWHELPRRADILTPVDRRASQAYNDAFAREVWTGGMPTRAQLFGVLRALVDHPAVSLAGQREGDRLEIRHGRLGLRFSDAGDGTLAPHFELGGVTLSPEEVGHALGDDDQHLIYVWTGDGLAGTPAPRGGVPGRPQVLLSRLDPAAAALVRALASVPSRFPVEAHDALAARLEALQETLDVDFPSQWTRTIAPADGRIVTRLELLASGALEVQLGVQPVTKGPMFRPGEGPALVLEGQGNARHGARRDRARERQDALGLVQRLGLGAEATSEDGADARGDGERRGPWSWRVSPGDPALQVIATLKELGDETLVEWADDEHLFSLGSVGRSDMRMKVADRKDWFEVEGGAAVSSKDGEVVPLSALFAAIREGRRYVPVGARGFVRIEETLRAALVHAEAALFERHATIQLPAVAVDPLFGLVEHEAQIEATDTFAALRQRMREGAGERPELPPALEAALRPYQRAGVDWMARLAHWGAGAILADEMGLGKTVQTLAMLVHRAALGPALVVAPTSVVPNWLAEGARFAPSLAFKLYRGPARAALRAGLGAGDVLVTSYAVATLDAAPLATLDFATLVVDEAQAIKNAATDRSKALRRLRAGWRLGLTGTPVENHVGEVWSLFRVLSPGLLGSWEQFRHRYAVPIEKFGDVARRQALAALLRPFVLRRVKDEVARELPPRTEVVRTVRLSEEEEHLYEELRRSFLAEMAEAKHNPDRDAGDLRFVVLAALTRLRQLCCHPRLVYPRTMAGSSKAAYLLELLGELRAGGHRTLVFSQFRSFLELLAPRLRQHGFRVLVLDGTTPAEAREERIAAFQSGAADVFLISLKAGGFGLNLTAADTVIHLDPWWNPAVEDQATARAHRIGQDRPVTAVRLVARGTIEEAVLGLHAEKRALAAALLEGTDLAATLTTEDLMTLIRDGDPRRAEA